MGVRVYQALLRVKVFFMPEEEEGVLEPVVVVVVVQDQLAGRRHFPEQMD
jgi:hypothetical protein